MNLKTNLENSSISDVLHIRCWPVLFHQKHCELSLSLICVSLGRVSL